MNNNSNKRFKTAASICITGLPALIIAEVSSYLAKENRALFAVAWTAPASSWQKCHWSQRPTPICNVILSIHEQRMRNEWETFDFFDIQESVAAPHSSSCRLDDGVLKAVLICIDSRVNLKSLWLTNCHGISGHGLEPLRKSIVLERIDLSMVKRRSESYMDSRAVSMEVVLPILNDIVETEGQSLIHIQLPKKWRSTPVPNYTNEYVRETEELPILTDFMVKYSKTLKERSTLCPHVYDQEVEGLPAYTFMVEKRQCGNMSQMGMHLDGHRYGIQTATCYECTTHFCLDGDCMQEDWTPAFEFCDHCEKYYCIPCNPCPERKFYW